MSHDHSSTSKRSELQMARSMCWHCQSESTGEYFCQQCVKVQPLSKEFDYFTCLGLPRLLTIDREELESKYYEMSRSFHPDYFQQKTDVEQEISLKNSALLNTAYRTLKDPVRRAEYLVQLEAGNAKDIRNSPPAELFEEILSLQEDIEEFESLSPENDSAERETLRQKITEDRTLLEQRQKDMEQRLISLFATWDKLQVADNQEDASLKADKLQALQEMREILSNRTYVRNIVQDLIDKTS